MEKIDKRIALWIVIGVLFVVALFLVFKAGASSSSLGSVTNAATSASSSAGMVGGC